ncbi:MAG TPA: hypothetical protein VFK05_34740 [Polyangiaceae bacterium]|nr:hypothetical protein [Polyangiaceae bacterium]
MLAPRTTPAEMTETMALESSASHSDPSALDDGWEPLPDSNPLRVSLNTRLESGIPPARERHDSQHATLFSTELTLADGLQRMEAALANAVRTEANLGLLTRGLKHLASGAEAARAANTQLSHELDELRSDLARSREEEHALRLHTNQLEQLLALVRHETASERQFLIEEQDRFLAEVLIDHERQLSELRERLRQSNRGQSDADKIAELIAQRDQAREYATRCERERDLAWQELATGVDTSKKAPPEQSQRSPSAAANIAAISLRSVAVPAPSSAPDGARSSERSATSYSMSGEDVSD